MERIQVINPTSIFSKFNYVSTEYGSGKTYILCDTINNSAKGKIFETIKVSILY